MKACFLKIRHPERSEAENFLFREQPCPSAAEGPSYFCDLTRAADSVCLMRSRHAASWYQWLFLSQYFSFLQPRSFDSGSAESAGNRGQPLAFAQDDGGGRFRTEDTENHGGGTELILRQSFGIASLAQDDGVFNAELLS